MIEAWIVVREEKHIADKFWVCLNKKDAIAIANDVTAYWKEQHPPRHGSVDRTCYDDQIFHYDQEEGFRVYVVPVTIRGNGETKQQELGEETE